MQTLKKYPSFVAFLTFFSGILSGKVFSNIKLNLLLFLTFYISPLKTLSFFPLGNLHYKLRKKENIYKYVIINKNLHKEISEIIKKNFSARTSNFLKAIFLGKRTGIYSKYRHKFIKTGTLHFLAISGLHMGIIFTIIFVIFSLLRLNLKFKIIFSLIGILIYSTIVPLRPSVLRALIMIFFFSILFLKNTKTHPLSILGNAGLFSLLVFPEWAFDPGFHLSYMATTGIFLLFPVFNRLKLENNFLRNYIYIPFSVSLSAQLFVFPYIYFLFKNIPLISPISNIILAPLVFLILQATSFFLIFYPFSGFIIKRISSFIEVSVNFLFLIIEKLSNLNFYIYHKNINFLIFIFLTLIPLFLIFLNKKTNNL